MATFSPSHGRDVLLVVELGVLGLGERLADELVDLRLRVGGAQHLAGGREGVFAQVALRAHGRVDVEGGLRRDGGGRVVTARRGSGAAAGGDQGQRDESEENDPRHRRRVRPDPGGVQDTLQIGAMQALVRFDGPPAQLFSHLATPRICRNFVPIDPSDSRMVGQMTTNVLQSGLKWGTFSSRSRSGVAGLLPLRHLGSTEPFAPAGHAPCPFTAPSITRSTPSTVSRSRRSNELPSPRGPSSSRAPTAACRCIRPRPIRRSWTQPSRA